MNKSESNSKKIYDEWLAKIRTSEKKYAEYCHLIEEIREYYRNDRQRNKQNIFWSSVETLKPFLYFKQPQLYIIRTNKIANPVETIACRILEKALAWNMKQFDFDSVVKYARNDFLLSGMGILWEQYLPTFKTFGNALIKDKEQVNTTYVNPTMFLTDVDKVDVWEDVEWIARKTYMNVDEVIQAFGETTPALNLLSTENKSMSVYEIWDKKTHRIYYLSPECAGKFLRIEDDTLHLSGFFPCPKPIMATLTNDGIIPIPDYVEIKSLLDELDGVNNRMRLLMQAIKVSGCYDNSFPELATILDRDVTLISLSDFDKLKEAGGLKGIIDFVPIEQYISALQVLAERRQILMSSIYEVTGVSDIMRGSSNNVAETATAVKQKTNFGTLRNQDRQNDMQRFLKDLIRIKAEIICEQFSADTLASFVSADENINPAHILQAVQLLKTDKLRDMVIDLETDGCFSQDMEQKRILDVLSGINEMIEKSFVIISSQPALLPLYRQMIESAIATMPNARQFEAVLEASFKKIEAELNTPPQPQISPETSIMELQKQKMNQDFILKKEQNQIKKDELDFKKATQLGKILKTEE